MIESRTGLGHMGHRGSPTVSSPSDSSSTVHSPLALPMPKHVPTFKHLIATSFNPQPTEKKDKTVSELLAQYRLQRPTEDDRPDAGPSKAWAPRPGVTHGPSPDAEGSIHP